MSVNRPTGYCEVCDHGMALHDVENVEGDRPMCCVDGCRCGRDQPAAEVWHCAQILNGDSPLIVCERERLTALVSMQEDEIDRLNARLADMAEVAEVVLMDVPTPTREQIAEACFERVCRPASWEMATDLLRNAWLEAADEVLALFGTTGSTFPNTEVDCG